MQSLRSVLSKKQRLATLLHFKHELSNDFSSFNADSFPESGDVYFDNDFKCVFNAAVPSESEFRGDDPKLQSYIFRVALTHLNRPNESQIFIIPGSYSEEYGFDEDTFCKVFLFFAETVEVFGEACEWAKDNRVITHEEYESLGFITPLEIDNNELPFFNRSVVIGANRIFCWSTLDDTGGFEEGNMALSLFPCGPYVFVDQRQALVRIKPHRYILRWDFG